ncbi:MAG: alpha/beta hydrolase, partial [Verrucomicrobiota bacterium]|nr:alpha/beta hydrolase [Verrucomicrobiota bacterium]
MKTICMLTALAVVYSALAGAAAEPAVFAELPYGEDARQRLDLYLPPDYKTHAGPLPLILLIHGGGWEAGDKEGVRGYARFFVDQGFAAAGINYRLRPAHLLPTQITDCQSAVRWLRGHAKDYNLDPARVGAWGHSAGGHLAAALGAGADVQAVCDFCGPTDFTDYAGDGKPINGLPAFFGGALAEKWDAVLQASPALRVTRDSAPMLIVHAPDDELVPLAQSRKLLAALQTNGVPGELIELAAGTGGHGSRDFNSPDTARRVMEFFERYLVRPKLARLVIGPPGLDDARPLRDLAAHPEQWGRLRAASGAVLYADHVLNRQVADDADLTDLLARLRQQRLPLQLEVGAVKPWGETGAACFEKQQPMWARFLRCGAWIEGIAMDEPLNCCTDRLNKDMAYAAEETADFIARVRQAYPHWTVGDIEGFPALTADELIRWVDALSEKLKQRNVRGLDFFRIDTDWMHFVQNTGRGSWRDLRRVEEHCRGRGIPVSVVYWAADYPAMQKRGLADDLTWYVGVLQMGFDYAAAGGRPDQAVVQSWVGAPQKTLPETEPFTFTRSALDLAERVFKA